MMRHLRISGKESMRRAAALLLAVLMPFILSACLYKEVLKDRVYEANQFPAGTQTTAVGETSNSTTDLTPTRGETSAKTTVSRTSKSVTEKPSQTTTTSAVAQEDDKIVIVNNSTGKVSDIGFSFYGCTPTTDGQPSWGEQMWASDYVNYAFGSAKNLEMAAKYKVKVWIPIYSIYIRVISAIQNGSTHTAWQGQFDALYKQITDTGYDSAFAGWYLDEPTNMEALRLLSKYAKETYNRRFFVIFMLKTVSPKAARVDVPDGQYTAPEYTQYLTDVGFDLYWDPDTNRKMYQTAIDDMHATCPENARVWYVPDTYAQMSTLDRTQSEILNDANFSIRHMKSMLEFLRAEKNPGGLVCFAYFFEDPGEGIYGMYQINEKTKAKFGSALWDSVLAECKRIGKELASVGV